MDEIAIEGLLEAAKVRNAEVSIVYSALWNANKGMRPLQSLNEAIKEYDEIQKEIEANS